MKILQVAKYAPHCEMTGGQIRVLGLASALVQFATVDLLIIGPIKHETACFRISAPYTRIRYSPLRNKASKYGNFLRSLASGASLQSGRFPSITGFSKIVRSAGYDAIHAEELATMAWVLRIMQKDYIPVFYSAHNVEGRLALQALHSNRVHRRLLAPIESRRVKEEERLAIERASGVICVSDADQMMLGVYGLSKSIVVPNCPSSHIKPQPPAKSMNILCMGCFGWWPNEDGARWFLSKVLPLLRRWCSNVNVSFVGSHASFTFKRAVRRSGCLFHGNVPSVLPYLRQARALIVPLRYGSGTRIKIVESWASGVPVVSTTIGAEGLDVSSGHDILIADDPHKFAAALRRILEDVETYSSLRDYGLSRVARLSWQSFSETLERFYHVSI